MKGACIIFTLALGLLLFTMILAQAHDFYDYDCCEERHCAPIPSSSVKEVPNAFVLATGEVVGLRSPRHRWSKDGRYHLCVIDSKVRCLYTPPRGF